MLDLKDVFKIDTIFLSCGDGLRWPAGVDPDWLNRAVAACSAQAHWDGCNLAVDGHAALRVFAGAAWWGDAPLARWPESALRAVFTASDAALREWIFAHGNELHSKSHDWIVNAAAEVVTISIATLLAPCLRPGCLPWLMPVAVLLGPDLQGLRLTAGPTPAAGREVVATWANGETRATETDDLEALADSLRT